VASSSARHAACQGTEQTRRGNHVTAGFRHGRIRSRQTGGHVDIAEEIRDAASTTSRATVERQDKCSAQVRGDSEQDATAETSTVRDFDERTGASVKASVCAERNVNKRAGLTAQGSPDRDFDKCTGAGVKTNFCVDRNVDRRSGTGTSAQAGTDPDFDERTGTNSNVNARASAGSRASANARAGAGNSANAFSAKTGNDSAAASSGSDRGRVQGSAAACAANAASPE
jgi:hypothetical protein